MVKFYDVFYNLDGTSVGRAAVSRVMLQHRPLSLAHYQYQKVPALRREPFSPVKSELPSKSNYTGCFKHTGESAHVPGAKS